jgi:TIR domain-containing protein
MSDPITPLAFLSHSRGGKEIAARLKLMLGVYGTHAFVAHEDIQPAKEWGSVILEQLRACDVFLPVLTADFPRSNWADQETGVAVGLGKLVIPLKVEIDPYGFIAKYQAHRLPANPGFSTSWKLIRIMENNERLGPKVRGGLIKMFSMSMSFDDAGEKAEKLSEIDSWEPIEIEALLKVSTENSQINQSFAARRKILSMISKYKSKMTTRAKMYGALFHDITED